MELKDKSYQSDIEFLDSLPKNTKTDFEEVKKENEEVKKLMAYREKENNGTAKTRLPNPLALILIVTGSLLMVVAGLLLIGKDTFQFSDFAIFPLVLCIIFGVFFLLFGLIKMHTKNKKERQPKVIILNEEDMKYKEEGKREVPVVTLDSEVTIKRPDPLHAFVSPLADIEDEEEALGTHKEVKKKNYDFFALNFHGVVKRFRDSCLSHSIQVKEEVATDFVAHFDSSRLFLLKDFSSMLKDNFAYALKTTFGGDCYTLDGTNLYSIDDLLASPNFAKSMEKASEEEDLFTFCLVDNLPSARIKEVFGPFLNALVDRNNRHKVRAGKDGKTFTITPNLVFLFLLPDKKGDNGYYLEKEMFPYAAILSLPTDIDVDDAGKVKVTGDPIRVSDFLQIVSLSKKDHPLSEEIWQKIDHLDEYVSTLVPYEMENDIANALENHVSLSLAYPESEERVVDEILSVDLLPNILGLIPSDKIEGEGSVSEFLDHEFLSQYILKDTHDVIAQYKSMLANPWKETKPVIPTKPIEAKAEDKVTNSEEKKEDVKKEEAVVEETKPVEEKPTPTVIEEEKPTPKQEEKPSDANAIADLFSDLPLAGDDDTGDNN